MTKNNEKKKEKRRQRIKKKKGGRYQRQRQRSFKDDRLIPVTDSRLNMCTFSNILRPILSFKLDLLT